MHKLKQVVLGCVVVMGVSLGLLVSGAQAQSGSLEPPWSAVNGSGDPVATTQTQPSWDQTLPTAERLVLVMGGAGVLDKNTGLVWEQSPDTTGHVWSDKFTVPVDARRHCLRRGTGGQMGWRLPSIHELTSLVVPGNPAGGPDLPAGHPFDPAAVQSNLYWSATANVEDPTRAWGVVFTDGGVGTFSKTDDFVGVWCVRGGGPLSEY